MDGLEEGGVDVGHEFLDGICQEFLFHPWIRLPQPLKQQRTLLLNLALGTAHTQKGAGQDDAADEGLTVVSLLLFDMPDGGIFGIQRIQEAGISTHGRPLEGPPLRYDVEAVDASDLSLLQLRDVAEAEEGIGILHADHRVCVHPLANNLHLGGTQAIAHGALDVDYMVDFRRRSVTAGMPRVAHDHGVTPLFVPLLADFEVPDRLERHIVRRILSVRPVGSRIDTVEGEIGLVLRPLPVVFVSSEGRNRHGRRAHEAHVGIHRIQGHIVLLPRPH